MLIVLIVFPEDLLCARPCSHLSHIHSSHNNSLRLVTIITPGLQKRKLELREVKKLAPAHTVSDGAGI